MVLVLRALLFIGGLFFAGVGIGFLLTPVSSAAGFGLAPQGVMGLATLRADMTAFFIVAGGCLIWGGWSRKGDPLLVSAALMAIALVGRIVTLASDGDYEGFWQPMMIEAVTAIIALIGSRMLPHTAFEPED